MGSKGLFVAEGSDIVRQLVIIPLRTGRLRRSRKRRKEVGKARGGDGRWGGLLHA